MTDSKKGIADMSREELLEHERSLKTEIERFRINGESDIIEIKKYRLSKKDELKRVKEEKRFRNELGRMNRDETETLKRTKKMEPVSIYDIHQLYIKKKIEHVIKIIDEGWIHDDGMIQKISEAIETRKRETE